MIKKVCYWCGNTNMTWINSGERGDGDFIECENHEYINGKLSIYAEDAIKLFPIVKIVWKKND